MKIKDVKKDRLKRCDLKASDSEFGDPCQRIKKYTLSELQVCSLRNATLTNSELKTSLNMNSAR